jgi:hypothetical protein
MNSARPQSAKPPSRRDVVLALTDLRELIDDECELTGPVVPLSEEDAARVVASPKRSGEHALEIPRRAAR